MDLLTLMAAAEHEPNAVTFWSAEAHSRYECAACTYKSVLVAEKQYGLGRSILANTRFAFLRRIPCYTCGVTTNPHSSLQEP